MDNRFGQRHCFFRIAFAYVISVTLTVLDVFKPDENFMEHEEKYKQLKKGTFMKMSCCDTPFYYCK